MQAKMTVGYSTVLPRESVYDIPCPLIHALNLIGGKWKLPILWHLADTGGCGFNALGREVKGITNMMLGKCLKELERDGLVSKTELAEGKVRRVKYALTPQGWRLLPTLKELYQWGKEHLGVESVCQQG